MLLFNLIWGALALLALYPLFTLLVMPLLHRPWSGDVSRDFTKPASAVPYSLFRLGVASTGLADKYHACIPAPWRVAELANMFMISQVMFALVQLDIPNTLVDGPKTPADIAKVLPPTANIDWLARLLAAAHAMGMLNCRLPASSHKAHTGALTAVTRDEPEYALNAVSAALTSSSPVNMAAFVALSAVNFQSCSYLTEGILTGTAPHKLHTGADFWAWTHTDPKRAHVFSEAMVQAQNLGARSVPIALCSKRYQCVIDVGGGMGGLVASLLQNMPGLQQGVVYDLPEVMARAQKVWSATHAELLPRVRFVAGNVFEARTMPAPPTGSSSTAYILYNVLHNWPDADCVKILTAIKLSAAEAAGVRLLVVEFTTIREVLPGFEASRHSFDMAMLVNFGDGRERNVQQFQDLFEAAGWRLVSVTPTNSPFMIIEAEPWGPVA